MPNHFHKITSERCRRILGRPKVWGPDGDGDDTLTLWRTVDGEEEVANLYADGDGVSDFTLHQLGGFKLTQAGLPARSITYESLDAIVAAGWAPYGCTVI